MLSSRNQTRASRSRDRHQPFRFAAETSLRELAGSCRKESKPRDVPLFRRNCLCLSRGANPSSWLGKCWTGKWVSSKTVAATLLFFHGVSGGTGGSFYPAFPLIDSTRRYFRWKWGPWIMPTVHNVSGGGVIFYAARRRRVRVDFVAFHRMEIGLFERDTLRGFVQY